MGRPLNYIDSGFNKVDTNLYVSEDIQKHKDHAEISKWVTDYEKACPKQITSYFTLGRKSNNAPWHPLYVNRYMPLSRLITEIQDNTLNFISPLLWQDPFERVFYQEKLAIKDKQYDIRCICSTYDYVENEEAAWNRNNNEDTVVRVSFDFDKFCKMLNNIGQRYSCAFYISIADYSQSKDNLIIQNIKTPYKSIEDYIKIMSLKRKAFAYENEMRIFAVFEISQSPVGKVVPFNISPFDYEDVIYQITLPPMLPTKQQNETFDYDTLQEAKNSPIKTMLSTLLPNDIIKESRLYSIKK